jgi:uncharacterized membrane protein HdeD (DUF308 family)
VILAQIVRGLAVVLGLITIVLGVLVVTGPPDSPLVPWVSATAVATVGAVAVAFALRGAAQGRENR